MKEEEIIKKHLKGNGLFRTPDGYFDAFTDKLMKRIAQEKPEETRVPTTTTLFQRLQRPLRYAAAAVVAGICIVAGTYFWTRQDVSAEQMLTANTLETLSDDDLDAAMDYEMLDNHQIASYLTEAY